MKHHMEFEHLVPFPLERAFAFFANPKNLPRIMPASSCAQLIALNRVPPPEVAGVSSEKAAGVGSSIVTSFRVFAFLPIRRRWVARITEFEWNRYFADVQEEGPFKRWNHRHEFASAVRDGAGGTLVRDVIRTTTKTNEFAAITSLCDSRLLAHFVGDIRARYEKGDTA
jgi:ligand-binding SRPBCC domain-containing protein